MRWFALLTVCLVPVSVVDAGEPPPESRAFVAAVVSNVTPFVNQPIRITLEFGVDRPFFEAHAVQLFRQELDVPVQVQAPWVSSLPGTRTAATARPVKERGQRFALNGGAAETPVADVREIDGRTFDVYRIERTVVPTRAGALQLAAPTLRFAHASRFEEDFVGGRVPLDRTDAVVRGEAVTIRVQPLPADNRPPAFVDAVGHFRIEAETDRTDVDVGERFHLRVRIAGDGNLAALTPPVLRDLPGLHVYATRDEHDADGRLLRLEVAVVRPDVTLIPPIPFAFFDPGPPAGYVVVRTQPQPLRVRSPDAETEAIAEPATTPPTESGSRGVPWLAVIAAVLVGLVLGWGIRRGTARPGEAPEPEPVRARLEARVQADRVLRSAAEGSARTQADALVAFLAAHLDCRPAAVIGPDLASRLEAFGLSPALAARAATLLESMVAARYGGPDAPWDASVVEELKAAFQAD